MKSIKKNYMYNLVFQIFTMIIPLVTTPYLSRILGAEGIGIFSYSLSIVSYFIVLGSIGVASYGQREIAMNRDNTAKCSKIFFELFFLKSLISLIFMIFYIVLIFFQKNNQIIYIILCINIFASVLDVSWFFQGLEEYKYISIRNIFIKIIFTILIFVLVKEKNDLNIYILLNSLSLIISSIVLWIKIPKLLVKINLKNINIFKHLKNTLIYFLPQIATQIYTVLDKVMLGAISDIKLENGYYEQAHKIIIIALTIITSLNTVVSPRMAYYYKKEKHDEIEKQLLKSLRFSCLLAIPMVFGLISISNGFVDWFFGNGYQKVKLLLCIFAPAILIISLSNCLGVQYLTPCGKRAKSAVVLWIGALLNIILNLILIPKYYSVGAIISSVISEFIILVLYFYLSKKVVKIKILLSKIYKYFIAAIFMALITSTLCTYLDISIISTAVECLVGMVIYIFTLILLNDEFLLENLKKFIIRKGER